MQNHPTSLHIHLVATTCVLSLTSRDLVEAMPVSLLSSAVTQLLYAMKTFPSHQQVRGHARCLQLQIHHDIMSLHNSKLWHRMVLLLPAGFHQILSSYWVDLVAAKLQTLF